MEIRKALQALFPFAPAPSIRDAQLWGVWNRRQKCWAEPPGYAQEGAERIAAAMVDAYASGWARRDPMSAAGEVGLRFRPHPQTNVKVDDAAWGVWDQALERWAERPCYVLEWAERIANVLNEAYAAGLTDALIVKVRPRRRRPR